MAHHPDSLLERARHALLQCGDARCILGVAGGPGAGKSTFAQQLTNQLNKTAGRRLAGQVAMDGFHLTRARLAQLDLTPVKGSLATFDASLLHEALKRLKTTAEKVDVPDYSRTVHDVVVTGRAIDAERIVIIEGNYLFVEAPIWRDIRELINLRVFLDTPWPTCRVRLIERYVKGGRGIESATAKVDTVDFENYSLTQESKQFAHIII